MLVKVALLFLAALVVIGWLGSLMGRRPRWLRAADALLRGLRGPAACPACGRPRPGAAPCPCGRA